MRYIEVGNTEIAVGKIKECIDADVFKIEMKNPYSKEYNPCIPQLLGNYAYAGIYIS